MAVSRSAPTPRSESREARLHGEPDRQVLRPPGRAQGRGEHCRSSRAVLGPAHAGWDPGARGGRRRGPRPPGAQGGRETEARGARAGPRSLESAAALQAPARGADPSRMARLAAPLLAWLACWPAAAGEIYRWTDPQGRVHFTQDLSQVPPEQRATAAGAARGSGGGRLQTFESAPAGDPAALAPAPGDPVSSPTRTAYRVPVQRAGASMLVIGV